MLSMNYANKNQISQMMMKGGPQVRPPPTQPLPQSYHQGGAGITPPQGYMPSGGGVQPNMMMPQHMMAQGGIPPHMMNNMNQNFNLQNRRSMEMMVSTPAMNGGNNMLQGIKEGFRK